jgi:hypothetical protein
MVAFLTGIKIRPRLAAFCILVGQTLYAPAAITATILAGGETDLPADAPETLRAWQSPYQESGCSRPGTTWI